MAITHAGKKLDAVTAELASRVADNFRGFFSGDVAGSEILHGGFVAVPAQGHQIAAKSDIVGSQRHTHAGGFERRTAGVIHRRVVTHDAHVADVAAGRKTFWDDVSQAENTVLRQPIHVGRARRFEWRPAAEAVDRIIRHAVALENDIFHCLIPAEKYLSSSRFQFKVKVDPKL